jgi:hypothetical protein
MALLMAQALQAAWAADDAGDPLREDLSEIPLSGFGGVFMSRSIREGVCLDAPLNVCVIDIHLI